MKKDTFEEHYKTPFDFTHENLERGLMLDFFICKERPDYKWMFSKDKPETIADIPEGIREEYVAYLKATLIEFGYFEESDFSDGTYENACKEEYYQMLQEANN